MLKPKELWLESAEGFKRKGKSRAEPEPTASVFSAPLALSTATSKVMGKLVKSKSVLGAGAKDKGSELKSVTGPKPKDSKSRTGKQDVILAVMGMTGAGKSSFISNATGSNKIRIGDTLYSETSDIRSYRVRHGGINFVLVDTPGFDDSYTSNEDITKQLMQWLEATFRKGKRLNGIIYIHDIKKPRIQGSALQHMRMFRRLCGQDAFSHVVLATSFWDQVSPSSGASREKQLMESRDFWAPMIEKGAKVMRITQERSTCLCVLNELAANAKVDLLVQHEIVVDGKGLSDTTVIAESGEEKIRRVDKELRQVREQERAKMKEQLDRSQEEHDREMTRLRKEQRRRERSEKEKLQREERAHKEALRADKRQRDWEKEQLRFQIANPYQTFKHVWPCNDTYASMYGCNCNKLRSVFSSSRLKYNSYSYDDGY